MGLAPGGAAVAAALGEAEKAARLVKEAVAVPVAADEPLAVSLLLAELDAVRVEEGVEPTVRLAVGEKLRERVSLFGGVAEGDAPRDRLAVAVPLALAPRESEALPDGEGPTLVAALALAETKTVLLALGGALALTLALGVPAALPLDEGVAPRVRLAVALGVPLAPVEGDALPLADGGAPRVRLAVAVPVDE